MPPRRAKPSGEFGIIVGIDAIARVFGRHKSTILDWIKCDGFPAYKIKNKTWCTTERLIDEWLRNSAA